MAMHSAVILVEENRQLRSKNKRQKKKRAKRKAYIATGGVLSVQEGLNRLQIASTELVGRVTDQGSAVQTRAPRTCSLCRSLAHTARTCPLKEASN